jgi:hypothetical protein
MMVAGDFFALSSATDNVRASSAPNVWRVGNLTIAGIILGFCDLVFCIASLAVGRFALGLSSDALRTLTVVTLVYSGQAIFYISRERRHLWRLPARLLADRVVPPRHHALQHARDPGHPDGAFAGNHRSLRIRRGNRPGFLPGHREGHTVPASRHRLTTSKLDFRAKNEIPVKTMKTGLPGTVAPDIIPGKNFRWPDRTGSKWFWFRPGAVGARI